MPNPKKLLETLYGVPMQDGEKLPLGIKRATERAKESKSVLPVAGARQARQAIQGYLGMDPSFSVMDPEAHALESAYRGGETASVLGDLFASLTPFATASALSKANQVPGLAELIAYHGSPHKFKKFDASKIGTGEGAQAYGHGLYFAENPKVAKDYADVLASPKNMVSDKRGVYIEPSPVTSGKYMLATKSEVGQPYGVAGDATQFIYSDHEFPNIASAIKFAKRQGLLSKNDRPRLTAIGEDRKYIPVTKASDVENPEYTQFIASDPGSIYTVDIPDEKIAQMLDWDKPLSQQPKAFQDVVSSLPRFQDPYVASKTTGGEAYGELAGKLGGRDKAAESLRQAGIPGIKYLDQVSRNKPLKDIKREFLNELPENASIDEVVELLGTGTFSPKNEAIIKELAANDWLGFDYPAQSLSTALSPSARNYDLSPSLMRAINEAQEGGTRNFVVFPGEEQNIKMLDINGEPQMAKGGAVRISDNPDTMLLELMSAPKMQAGGAALKAFRDKLLAQHQRSLAKDPRFKQAPSEVTNLAGKSYAQWAAEQQYKHELEDALAKISGAPEKKMSVQDLPVGSRLLSIVGDRTQADKILRSVNETPLANEVILHGGPRFGQGKLAEGKEDFWASNASQAKAVQNRVDAAAERAKGKPVIGVYTAMGALDSDQYAKHFAESLIEQYPFTGMTGKQVDAFNKEFRKKYPQFAGVDNPEFVDQIMANTKMRKAFVNEHLKKKNIEKFNIPDGLATRHAITVPELRDVPTGLAGYSVGEMKPSRALEKGSYIEHPSYDTAIPGKFMGGLELMQDFRDLFPDATQRMLQTLRNNPKFQGPDARKPESQLFGTFGMQGAEQEVTQKLIDELAAREELIKQLGILPYKKGGEVKKVKISNNPDAMQLELMRKKKHA